MENKKRLTDVNPIIRNLTAMKSMYDAIALDGMIKALEEAPAVDAAEVLREQWISVKDRLQWDTRQRVEKIPTRMVSPDDRWEEIQRILRKGGSK